MTNDELPVTLTLGDAKKLLASLKSACSQMQASAWDTARRYGDDSPEDCAAAEAVGKFCEDIARIQQVVNVADPDYVAPPPMPPVKDFGDYLKASENFWRSFPGVTVGPPPAPPPQL